MIRFMAQETQIQKQRQGNWIYEHSGNEFKTFIITFIKFILVKNIWSQKWTRCISLESSLNLDHESNIDLH